MAYKYKRVSGTAPFERPQEVREKPKANTGALVLASLKGLGDAAELKQKHDARQIHKKGFLMNKDYTVDVGLDKPVNMIVPNEQGPVKSIFSNYREGLKLRDGLVGSKIHGTDEVWTKEKIFNHFTESGMDLKDAQGIVFPEWSDKKLSDLAPKGVDAGQLTPLKPTPELGTGGRLELDELRIDDIEDKGAKALSKVKKDLRDTKLAEADPNREVMSSLDELTKRADSLEIPERTDYDNMFTKFKKDRADFKMNQKFPKLKSKLYDTGVGTKMDLLSKKPTNLDRLNEIVSASMGKAQASPNIGMKVTDSLLPKGEGYKFNIGGKGAGFKDTNFIKPLNREGAQLFSPVNKPGNPMKQIFKQVPNISKGGLKALFNPAAGANTGLMAGMGPAGWAMMGLNLLGDKLFKPHTFLGKIFSDKRLKEKIVTVGTSPSGIPIKEFDYKGKKGRYRGVISEDVPWATSKHPKVNYDVVDYSMIDVDFKKIA